MKKFLIILPTLFYFNITSVEVETPNIKLKRAVITGDVNLAKQAVNEGANIENTEYYGVTPLATIAHRYYLDLANPTLYPINYSSVVDFLLAQGANPKAINEYGKPAEYYIQKAREIENIKGEAKNRGLVM